MKRKLLFIFFVQFIYLCSKAQEPEEILNRWSDQLPIEKIYLHLDRDSYLAGENIWFKAYLYSDNLPDTISTTLYVELLNESSAILSRTILPVFFGNTIGQFELPDSLKTGLYFIRAYSPTMLNHDTDFIYKRSLFIYGKKNNAAEIITPKEKMIRLDFFPEGGNLISNLSNTIAFKAIDENSLPATISGAIKNENNELLAEFSSYHDGMGMFDLILKSNEKYYAVLNGDTLQHKYYLPEQTNKGIMFRVMPDPRGKYFEIQQQANDPAFRAAYMIGQMRHRVVFRQEFSQKKEEIKGVINISNLNSGILQITVFNKDNYPLAERLSFVDNKEYIQPAELILDTINFSGKAKNIFSVLLKDTIQGSFSIAVTDPDYSFSRLREENIFSGLLLTPDLKGYIHNPAWYFSGDDDSVINALDLLMMTNGWRRFKWSELLKNTVPVNKYKDPGYITLSGSVNIRDTRKPFAEKMLLVFIGSADSSKTIQLIKTDKSGYFKLDSLLFFGKARILFSDIRGRKNQFIEVKLSEDSLTRSFPLPSVEKKPFAMNDPLVINKQSKLAYDYDAILRANGLMLEGVVVKARKKSAVQELEEKYASGMFSGFSERTIDLVNTNEVITQTNVFEYLRSRVPGLNITNNGFDYSIYYRQSASLSIMGPIPITLFLDEMQTDANVISSIPANQISMVKVFSSFIGAVGNGAGGVLAVYTKKGSDLYNTMPSSADQINYRGYSISKEFYSPDYTVDTTIKNKVDHRITLHWLPNIIVNGVNPEIPVVFYNNDRTKQFKIVVEGMTNAGKMVLIEKTISPAQKAF